MAEGVSLREFGRQIGVTGEAVRKAIAEGKVPADCVGTVLLSTGKPRPVITNPARAAEHWGKNRDLNQVRDKAAMSAGAKRGWEGRRGPAAEDDEDPVPAPTIGTGLAAGNKVPSQSDSKAITEAYKARMAKIDYEEKIGRLVNAEQVKAGFVNMVTTAKTRLLGVPSKAKSRIPTLTVRDIEVLEDLIAEALEEIAASGR